MGKVALSILLLCITLFTLAIAITQSYRLEDDEEAVELFADMLEIFQRSDDVEESDAENPVTCARNAESWIRSRVRGVDPHTAALVACRSNVFGCIQSVWPIYQRNPSPHVHPWVHALRYCERGGDASCLQSALNHYRSKPGIEPLIAAGSLCA